MPCIESGVSRLERRLATRAAYTPIVHEHDRTVFSEPVGVNGIPVVHPACEVLKADQWRGTLLPELTIGETGITDLSKFGRCGLMEIGLRHDGISLKQF
jgi:hypothetical protein